MVKFSANKSSEKAAPLKNHRSEHVKFFLVCHSDLHPTLSSPSPTGLMFTCIH